MQTTNIFLIGLLLILACVARRGSKRVQPGWSHHLIGWQKIFGVVGFILALLIVMNPELLALGLLGDGAFFDIMVLALSLQLEFGVFRAWGWIHRACSKMLGFLIRGVRRDVWMMGLILIDLGDLVLKMSKAVRQILCPRHTMQVR